jgi:hypothetical protein
MGILDHSDPMPNNETYFGTRYSIMLNQKARNEPPTPADKKDYAFNEWTKVFSHPLEEKKL